MVERQADTCQTASGGVTAMFVVHSVIGFVLGAIVAAGMLLAVRTIVNVDGTRHQQVHFDMQLAFAAFPVFAILMGIIGALLVAKWGQRHKLV